MWGGGFALTIGRLMRRVRLVISTALYVVSVVAWMALSVIRFQSSRDGRWDSTQDSVLASFIGLCANPGTVSIDDGKLGLTVSRRGPETPLDPPIDAANFGPDVFTELPAPEVSTRLSVFEIERSYGVGHPEKNPVDRYWSTATATVRVPTSLLFACSSLALLVWPAKLAIRYLRRSRRPGSG